MDPVGLDAAERLAPLRGTLRNRSRRAVFLCYHSVHPAGPPLLSITPAQFEAHLHELDRAGFGPGRIADLVPLARGMRFERRAFLLFDDGFRDNYEHALPLLRVHGFSALVFLVTDLVDRGSLLWPEVADDVAGFPDAMRALTWEMVGEMAEYGTEFGSHTTRHARLTTLSDEDLAQTLLDSRRVVQSHVGACDTIAYPFGEWDLRLAMAALAAGYSWAFTLPPRGQADVAALGIPRIPIDHRDDAARFRCKLLQPCRVARLSSAVSLARVVRGGYRRVKGGNGGTP